MRLKTLLLTATLVASSSSAFAGPISALYVFGDSLSDNGNLSLIGASVGISVPNAPYAPGHATNGLTAVEQLALQLGLPLTPALTPVVGGNNYAVIGAATGPVPVPVGPDNVIATYGITLPVPTGILNAQVPLFLSRLTAPIDPDALFFIWGGANDLFILPTDDVAAQAAANIGLAIDLLYGAGARRFLIPNLPDLGLTPSAGAAASALSSSSDEFNVRLGQRLATRQFYPGITLAQYDTFQAFNRLVADPGLYGFTNVEDECYVGVPLAAFPLLPSAVCSTPSSYLFWDGSHPTAAGHALLGDGFSEAVSDMNAVPEPATLTLTAAALVGLAVRRRRAA